MEVKQVTNTRLLKSEMAKKGFTQRSLSKAIGVSLNTLNQKINNQSIFNTEEAKDICRVLGIASDALKCAIFLA